MLINHGRKIVQKELELNLISLSQSESVEGE